MNGPALLIVAVGGLLALAGFARVEPKPEPKPAPAGIAVIELFTSEGCSSCPPADEALAAIAAKHPGLAERIVPLAFHVDYWDKLGWPDRFASPEFTQRQKTYASSAMRGLYTPQMVVNGRVEFVGSDRARATKVIESELRVPAAVTVQATLAERKGGEAIKVAVDLVPVVGEELPKGAAVFAALIEDGLSSEVKRGENTGKSLKHDRVVRAFAAAKPDGRRHAVLELTPPKGLDDGKSRVVVFVQQVEDGRLGPITGAAQFSVTAPR